MNKKPDSASFVSPYPDAEVKYWLQNWMSGPRQLVFIAGVGTIMLLVSLAFIQIGLI